MSFSKPLSPRCPIAKKIFDSSLAVGLVSGAIFLLRYRKTIQSLREEAKKTLVFEQVEEYQQDNPFLLSGYRSFFFFFFFANEHEKRG